MKFSIKDFFCKCDQIRRKLRIWSHLLKKSLMENFVFCGVYLENCSVICAVTLYYVLHQTQSEFWHISNYVYSGICMHIQAYSALLWHIKAYSGIFSTLCKVDSQLCHVPSPGILITEGIFKTLKNFHQAYSELRYTLNSLFRQYSEPCVILAYATTWYIGNSEILITLS